MKKKNQNKVITNVMKKASTLELLIQIIKTKNNNKN